MCILYVNLVLSDLQNRIYRKERIAGTGKYGQHLLGSREHGVGGFVHSEIFPHETHAVS